ncbi:transposase [Gordonia sp. NPDC058843]|uniref:transposase n=1 Tax=Gordonia sp. NPDC058843 TaxID=3346648 RepID=UPI0036ADB769
MAGVNVELAAEGKTGEEIAAELNVSAATLYNWRRQYGGIDADSAKKLRSAYRQLPQAQSLPTPMPGCVSIYARKNLRHGFRQAWAWLRFDG